MHQLSRRSALGVMSFAAFAATATNVVHATSHFPSMEVFLSPTCGCCKAWVAHVEKAGFMVRVTEARDLAARKRAAGVPDALRSCHTAIIDGYFIEGHVPATDIVRLLLEKPLAFGLAVPDMPIGSPGMEVAGVKADAFDTMLILADGKTRVWAKHGA
jgi:hypothetical protein